MLAADFGTCVSKLEKKVKAFGKKMAMDGYPMPVTIKSFPSAYFEKDSYEGHNYSLLETEYRTWDGTHGRSGFMLDEILCRDAGDLTGRASCAFLDNHSAIPYWPTAFELHDHIIELAEEWEQGDFGWMVFSAFFVEEDTTDYLRGVLSRYEYTHEGRQFHPKVDIDEEIIILLHPNDR